MSSVSGVTRNSSATAYDAINVSPVERILQHLRRCLPAVSL